MKNTLLFLLLLLSFNSSLAQSILEKTVNLQVQNAPLKTILIDLSTQTSAQFAYDKNRIPTNKKFSLALSNATLEKALAQLFSETNIQFKANKNYIALFRKNIPYHTISGYIRDTLSEEALIAANVFETQYYRGTSSNNYGFYSLSLPEGRHLLKATFIGYQELADTIDLYGDIQQDLFLKVGNDLAEVIVVDSLNTAEEATAILQQSQDSGEKVNVEKAKSLPTFGGQSDILKAVQLLPGVISGGLNGNKLYVRGGHLDQNLVLLDDVPLYNLNHILGVISIINGDIIHSAKTYLDGIPARFGGRLSSLVDIRTKEGNKQKYHGGAAFGFLIGSAYLEGPIQKGKHSFIVSTRRILLPISIQPEDFNIQFNDLNVKANFRISKKDRLFFSVYTGKDVIAVIPDDEEEDGPPPFKETTSIDWRNTAISLRWNRILGNRLFMNTTLLQGTFDYNILNVEIADSLEKNIADFKYNSFIQQYGLKVDFNYIPSTKHHLRFGASYRYLKNNPGKLDIDLSTQGAVFQTSKAAEIITAHQPYVYLEDEYQLNKNWNFSAGVHLATIQVKYKTWWSPQVRFLINYSPSSTNFWSFSYGEMAQYIHLLNNAGIEAGDSKWVATTENVRPSTSNQLALNYQSFFHPNWKLKLSTYYKRMQHLRRFKIGATVTNSIDNWEENTVTGNGKAYGIELLVAKTKGTTQGWLSYTLSRNQRQFPDLLNNKIFPHQQDRRHIFNINLNHQFKEKKGKKRHLNLVWSFATGQWATLPERGFLSQSGVLVPDFQVINNFQLRPNHRLDIAYNRAKTGKKGFQHQWTFGIYNVYGQISPYATFLEYIPTTEPIFDLQGEYFTNFPIPFINYGFKF